MNKLIVISTGTELLRIPADRLVYISADGNYSDVVTQDNRKTMVSMQLGQIEDLIFEQLGADQNYFARVGRGLVVNVDYVFSIELSSRAQRIILSDCHGCYHSLSASRDALANLKIMVEANNKKNGE